MSLRAAPSFASRYPRETNVVVLDGGFGTTLETEFSQDISGPLWSARLIDTNPEVIVDAHLAFLRSGADIILTSTYQCSYLTFSRAGYTREEAERSMRKAAALAKEARDRYLAEGDGDKSRSPPRIALSLGSFGAMLPGAEEFGGVYPPPFGPAGKANTFENDRADLEEASIRALTEFYVDRLRVFVPVWDSVDYVAFETVPLRREIRAIRRAMGVFLYENKITVDAAGVRWWISTVWPDGLYPEVSQNGERDTRARDVVEALLGAREGEARPWGVGVNCTSVDHLPRIVREMGDALEGSEKNDKTIEDDSEPRPWLVVYPNGGDVYEGRTQTWIVNDTGKGEQWAEKVWQVVGDAVDQAAWAGVIVGGCCRTGPEEIAGLVRLRARRNSTE